MVRRLWLGLGLACLTACKGAAGLDCEADSCPDGERVDGECVIPDSGQRVGEAWQSASWDGGWATFCGKQRVVFTHSLGRVPLEITPYVSFGDGLPAALAPGDHAEIHEVSDRRVVITNNTNQPFRLRLVLR